MKVLYKNKVILSFMIFLTFSVFAYSRPIVSSINAKTNDSNKIILTWQLPKDLEKEISALLVFRSENNIISFSQISEQKPLSKLKKNATSFTDKVSDYKDYYYAVLAIVQDEIYDVIIPSVNSTVVGVHLKITNKNLEKDNSASAQEKLYPAGAMRETPLPSLDLVTGKNNSEQVKISDETKNTVKSLLQDNQKAKTKLLPYVFEEDLISPDGGDDYLLFEVLKTTFIKKKYADAILQLQKLIATNRNENVSKRAQFYLGQSYYFTQKYDEAVNNFLQLSSDYPAISKKWINSSLEFLQIEN